MAAEPTDPTLGISPSRGPWAPGGDPWSQSNNGMGNGTSGANGDQPFFHFDNIMSLLMVLVCLCGVVVNGAVFLLLWFCLKRSRFSFYICSLASMDSTSLLVSAIQYICLLLQLELEFWGNIWSMLQMIQLGLLVGAITERYISVSGLLWDPWLCLYCFSSVVGLLIPGLAVCLLVAELVCDNVGAPCEGLGLVYVVTMVVTLLMLCVSSLRLLVYIKCGSPGTQPSRPDVSILLTVLAYLLLGLPYNVYFWVLTVAPDTEYVPGLWGTLGLLYALNRSVNPVIYFLVGRYRQQPDRIPLREVLQRVLSVDDEEGLSGWAPSSPQTLLHLLSFAERAAGSELDRPPRRAAAQEAGSPPVSPQGPCEEEAAPVLRH